MKAKISLISLICLFTYSITGNAKDLDHVVSGAEVENALEDMEASKDINPYLINDKEGDEVAKEKVYKDSQPDFIFPKDSGEIVIKNESRKKLEGSGYYLPGTFENKENYTDIDKDELASDLRMHSTGSINLSFAQNSFNYETQNDIFNRTYGEGTKHVKGGTIYLRSDRFYLRKDVVNVYWSLGGGIGFNSGRGIFLNNTQERSDVTFRLWELPADLGFGIGIPLYHWFAISGTAGPSAMALVQNRNDIQSGDKGRNKIQISYGQFADAQFKINLSGLNEHYAYELFTESKITNLFLSFNVRYQSYSHFQDQIKISGTSYGIGFNFEYL